MAILTDYARDLLARALAGRAPTLPAQVYAALGTGGSDATGLTGEAAGNGYARQRVVFTGSGTQRNADVVRFNFTAAAGTLTHIGLFDAATGGNALTWSALAQPVAVTAAGSVSLDPAAVTLAAA